MSRCTSNNHCCNPRNGFTVKVAVDPDDLDAPRSRGFSRARGTGPHGNYNKRRRCSSVPPDMNMSAWVPEADDGLIPESENNGPGATEPRLVLVDDGFESEDENDGERTARQTEWTERVTKRYNLWKMDFCRLADDILASHELRSNILHRSAVAELTLRQEALNESWALPGCKCDRDLVSDVKLLGFREIRYWGEICTGIVQAPMWHCETCKESWEPSPLCAGCFPHGTDGTSPLNGVEWFSCEILEGYAALGPGTGYLMDGPALPPAGLSKHGRFWLLPSVCIIFYSMARISCGLIMLTDCSCNGRCVQIL